ncbi:Ricin B lectin [Nosema bombycis CQ1]|uniref:Ricin B lectin n=1 Tax=Nosema bombycis (strain CQ1 / CVCC 102059) TaxID=578461 RepID=R0MQU8_NOSB1|nr:Ricin B lectin [Nosema bombycis CQ1]WGJ64368.1 ricin B lectin-like protein [Nosema bombycis]|eukprot:EOB15263.1 Ricin B lectin [Nosema bombycis CQ1]
MYWILFSVINSVAVLEENSYEVSNGEYLLGSDGNLVNKNDEKIKEPITVIVYNSIDLSQPNAIVSKDRKKVIVLDDNGNLVAKDTSLFKNYEKYGRLCLLKKNSKQPMCKALSHALDPSDDDEKKEEDEDKEEKEPKKSKKEDKNDSKDDFKDLESDIAEISNMSFSDSFLWSVDIADNEGLQRIINFSNKLCVNVSDGKLEMKACDKTLPGQRWKFRTAEEKPKEKRKKPKSKRIIEVEKEPIPHKHHMRPEDKMIFVQPIEEEYQGRTHMVEPGDEIVPKRSKSSKKKRRLEDTDDGESQEVEINLKKRSKREEASQQYVVNPPFSQQNLMGPPLNQQSMLVPQNIINPFTSWQMPPQPNPMPINYWPNQQQGESVSFAAGPPAVVNVQGPPSDKKGSSSSKPGSKNLFKSDNPPEKESESEETSESPEKSNEDKNNQIAMKVVSPMYNGKYFANPMGPYSPFPQMQPAVVVNNTTKTNEGKNGDSKKNGGGLGGLMGGLAKSSPLGSALSS